MVRRVKEEYAIVLDYLKHGYSEDSQPSHIREAIVQAIGEEHFVLLELVPSPDISLKPNDRVYIGEETRDKISYIKGVISKDRLTQTAVSELPFIIEKLVDTKEEQFVEFFNTCGPISLRAHQLELLPGIGKRHARDLIDARGEQPFVSFEDINKRVTSVPNPKKAVIQRILLELDDGDRHKLFVRV